MNSPANSTAERSDCPVRAQVAGDERTWLLTPGAFQPRHLPGNRAIARHIGVSRSPAVLTYRDMARQFRGAVALPSTTVAVPVAVLSRGSDRLA
jgi:hypothetical protein